MFIDKVSSEDELVRCPVLIQLLSWYFVWRHWIKTRALSDRSAGVPAKIQTKNHPNANLLGCVYNSLSGYGNTWEVASRIAGQNLCSIYENLSCLESGFFAVWHIPL